MSVLFSTNKPLSDYRMQSKFIEYHIHKQKAEIHIYCNQITMDFHNKNNWVSQWNIYLEQSVWLANENKKKWWEINR